MNNNGGCNVTQWPLGGAVALCSASMMSSSDRLSYDPLMVVVFFFVYTHAHSQDYWIPDQVTKTISVESTRNRKRAAFMF